MRKFFTAIIATISVLLMWIVLVFAVSADFIDPAM